jgi:Icc protein
MDKIISWVHFGDLHITEREEPNYRDFLTLIEEANRYMAGGIDFAFLPGDNADDGAEDEYQLVRDAVSLCRFPVHAITGDHDVISGNLDLFRKYLVDDRYRSDSYRSFSLGVYRFILLNSVDEWKPPIFGLSREQMDWLHEELLSATNEGHRVVVFMHAYPSEHGDSSRELHESFRRNNVVLVEMGHTHYNELACDGRTIYATTRSTGQIEEGPAGFSVTSLDDDIVSWKFKPIGKWPLVMITSPADQRLIIDPSSRSQVVRGQVQVRARIWGRDSDEVAMSIDAGVTIAMKHLGDLDWEATWDTEAFGDGTHSLTVRTGSGIDEIKVLVNQAGAYDCPERPDVDHDVDYENVLGEWKQKHILGTQLGPNENGHPWPPSRKREQVAR